jgi:hypothetical protein
MMGITSHNQETLTLENIDKTSLLNKKVIVQHRKDTDTPTLEGTITQVDPNGSCTITHPDKSSTTLALKKTVRAMARKARADITLTAMDSNGRLKQMECTRVEPFANPKGKTAEDRGATRYLGAYMSFLGWEEQERVTIKAIRNFHIQLSRIHPNLKNAKAAIQSILTARVASGRLVMPSNKKVTDLSGVLQGISSGVKLIHSSVSDVLSNVTLQSTSSQQITTNSKAVSLLSKELILIPAWKASETYSKNPFASSLPIFNP